VTPPECWISGGYSSPLRGARLKGSPRGGRHQPLLSESPTVFVHITQKGKTDWPWTMFNPESKKLRHETVFPQHLKKVFEMGAELTRQPVGIL
jgi:hypothetical protein